MRRDWHHEHDSNETSSPCHLKDHDISAWNNLNIIYVLTQRSRDRMIFPLRVSVSQSER